MTDSDSDAGGLEILTKANAVVGALEREQELTAQQIAELVDEPVSSTYRLLQSLAAIDWVETGTRRGLFRLGVSFMRVGGRFEDQIEVRREAFEPMRRLRLDSGWTTVLCVRRGLRAVCVERFDGPQIRSMALQVGDSLPLFVGAASLAILAFLPAGERKGLLAQFATKRALDGLAPPAPEDLELVLADTAERGYARSDSEVTVGMAGLAAPVFNHRGELVASLSMSGLRSPLLSQEEQHIAGVLEAAEVVSRRLGWEGA